MVCGINDIIEHCEQLSIFPERGNWHGQLGKDIFNAQGYPRADIDVARVRTDRHRLACLNTDHKVISSQVERMLAEFHAATRCVTKGGGASGSGV